MNFLSWEDSCRTQKLWFLLCDFYIQMQQNRVTGNHNAHGVYPCPLRQGD